MLPPIDPLAIPADVRKAGPQAEKLYGAALQFEGLLVQQITDQMFQSVNADGSDGSSDSSDGSADDTATTGAGADGGPYASLLPGTLADSITSGGGLGLAHDLYRSMALRLGLGQPPVASGSGNEPA